MPWNEPGKSGEIYVIGTDFDGTLTKNGELVTENIEAVRKFREAGNLFVLVTGRHGYDAVRAAEKSGIGFDYISASDGAVLFGPESVTGRKRELIYEKTCSPDRLEALCALIIENDPCWLSKESTSYACSVPLGWNSGEQVGTVNKNGRPWMSPEQFFADPHPFSMLPCGFEERELSREVTERINREFGDYVAAYFNDGCVDIVPAGIGKASGLTFIAEAHGIPKENIWTIGDDYNDLPMLRAFNGCTVARGELYENKLIGRCCPEVCDLIHALLEKQGKKQGEEHT